MENDENVIIGASVYKQKYYINEKYKSLPSAVLEELREICVIYANKLHCIFTINFDEYGEIYIDTKSETWDYHYDEIGAKLDSDKILRDNRELVESLEMWYETFIKNNKEHLN